MTVGRKKAPAYTCTDSHHKDMVCEQLAFNDAVSYTQWWKSKLAEVIAWGIKPPTFRLGVPLQKKVRHPKRSVTDMVY